MPKTPPVQPLPAPPQEQFTDAEWFALFANGRKAWASVDPQDLRDGWPPAEDDAAGKPSA